MVTRILLNIALWGLVRYAERLADDEASDTKARELRRYVEDRLHKLATRKQRGALAKTELDDRGLRFAQVFMKSRYLDTKIADMRAKVYPAH